MHRSKKTIILISLFILLTLTNISAKSRKNDEKRFQLGLGFTAGSASIFNFVQSIKLVSDSNYGEMTLDGTNSNLTLGTKQALITGNMFAAMQIGFQMRIMAHVFFSELDIIAEPMSNISSPHCDFLGMLDVGIRCPKWIMPYFAVGLNGTLGLYPDDVENADALYSSDTSKRECWRTSINNCNYVSNNIKISFGAHAKVGLDVKFKRFSVGVYCLYLVKDVFNEWTDDLPNYYKRIGISAENPDVYGTLYFVASQFRFGASICWYVL